MVEQSNKRDVVAGVERNRPVALICLWLKECGWNLSNVVI